jgi:hypothetical protein
VFLNIFGEEHDVVRSALSKADAVARRAKGPGNPAQGIKV